MGGSESGEAVYPELSTHTDSKISFAQSILGSLARTIIMAKNNKQI